MPMATLYIFCGKMASGKSTLAKQIAEQNSVVLISEDELLGALYPGQILDVASYAQYSGKLKLAMAPILEGLLKNGTSVVLDFPANTVKQRKWIRDIVVRAEAKSEFHYLNNSEALCKANLKKRAASEPERHATDTVEMFDAITQYFEPPSVDEGFDILEQERS